MARFAIVASEYNSVIMDGLIAGATRTLQKAQADMTIIRVPGSFEIPLAVKYAAVSKKFDGIIALGCVLRGETPHAEYLSAVVSSGLSNVALETLTPIGFGVLVVDTVEQAMNRSGQQGNRGSEAAQAAIDMVRLLKEI
jgi:6,7-dimethyl-8-ribityllumazine synthase